MRDLPVGLDPPTLTTLSPLLHNLARNQSPRLVLALRPQDPLPEWITHVLYLGPNLKISHQGERAKVQEQMHALDGEQRMGHKYIPVQPMRQADEAMFSRNNPADKYSKLLLRAQDPLRMPPAVFLNQCLSREGISLRDKMPLKFGEPIVEMENVLIKYGEKQVLGAWTQKVNDQSRRGLWWTVRRGERWGVFGPNGQCQFCAILFSQSSQWL